MILKTLFWAPLDFVKSVLPFNRNTYVPSSENERQRVEYTRNVVRRIRYHTKRKIGGF